MNRNLMPYEENTNTRGSFILTSKPKFLKKKPAAQGQTPRVMKQLTQTDSKKSRRDMTSLFLTNLTTCHQVTFCFTQNFLSIPRIIRFQKAHKNECILLYWCGPHFYLIRAILLTAMNRNLNIHMRYYSDLKVVEPALWTVGVNSPHFIYLLKETWIDNEFKTIQEMKNFFTLHYSIDYLRVLRIIYISHTMECTRLEFRIMERSKSKIQLIPTLCRGCEQSWQVLIIGQIFLCLTTEHDSEGKNPQKIMMLRIQKYFLYTRPISSIIQPKVG